MDQRPGNSGHSAPRRAATIACAALLASVLTQGLGGQTHKALLGLGERLWPGYGSELRLEPGPPPSRPTPAPVGAKAGISAEEQAVLDLLAEEPGDPGQAMKAGISAEEQAVLDLLAEEPGDSGQPAGASDPKAEEAAAEARYQAAAAAHASIVARRTASVRRYVAFERGVGAAIGWLGEHLHQIFVLLVVLCGAVATGTRHHIALRPIQRRVEDRVAQAVSLAANLLLAASVAAQWRLRVDAGGSDDGSALLWGGGFLVMGAINVALLLRPRGGSATGGARGIGQALLCAPLYAVMAAIAGCYFVASEGYVAGLAVYLDKLSQNAQLYLQVGLYVWAGMLLRRTQIAAQIFAALRPWRLSPEVLASLVVLLAAVPTAYSGASGIFVIAAGALIFRELAAAGARPGLALASTAMSGSLGVVLSPCLLVVIVGYLTRIPSDELFGWGRWVYVLSGGLFAALALLTRTSPLRPRPIVGAGRESAAALRGLAPSALIFGGVLLVYYLLFGAGLDQHSAPVLLPVALLAILGWERRRGGAEEARPAAAATAEGSVHIGALLLLMALSAGLGGVIERSEVAAIVPATFASPALAMAALVVVLVLIGMVMDPYGAVILVQATLAKIAGDAGISAVHFWMVVLVAFELGYLTPPVALNHLLARQVIGEERLAAARAEVAAATSWWRRFEHYLLPISALAAALLIVAFGPLWWP
jgi:TRAP-type C4-dicarboxylate transport system permease large subunit